MAPLQGMCQMAEGYSQKAKQKVGQKVMVS